MVQGMPDGGAWEDIQLIPGWAYGNDRTAGQAFTDYENNALICAQDGGWVDFDVAIPDQYEQVRLRLVVSAGSAFNHDIALWSAELRSA